MNFLANLIAKILLLLIPALSKKLQKYLEDKAAKKQKEKDNREAIERAINENDQRAIETQLGSTQTGKPTNHIGTSIVDSLPGVRK